MPLPGTAEDQQRACSATRGWHQVHKPENPCVGGDTDYWVVAEETNPTSKGIKYKTSSFTTKEGGTEKKAGLSCLPEASGRRLANSTEVSPLTLTSWWT